MTLKTALCLLILLPGFLSGGSMAAGQPVLPGDSFPEIRLFSPMSPEDRAYLQLPAGKEFTPSQIRADLVLIELLNVHCPHCQMQTFSYNELYKLIESNPETRGKIKMLGFAVGNLDQEVRQFKENYRIDFPILADPDFSVWRAVGGTATPYTLYLRQDKPGSPGIVTGTHLGLNTHYQQIYQSLIRFAAEAPEQLRQKTRVAAEERQKLTPLLSDSELEFRVRSAFTRFGMIEDFSKIALISGRQVYTALVRREQGRERLFAEVTSRASVCDICHDVHFIYLFERTTRIIAFEPLQLTKYGNITWNDQEVQTMRKRVVGRLLSRPQPFNPAVDSISSATMTSAIIFDSLAQGDELVSELRDQGLL